MKTSRNYLYMAALLLATTFMACSSESYDITAEPTTPQPEQPASSGKEVILTGTLADKGGEATRSVNSNGVATWRNGEKIAIYYQKTDGTYATDTATIKTYGSVHSITYTAKLTDPKTGTNVKLVYPVTAHDGAGGFETEPLLTSQNGALYFFSRFFDIATGSGIMTVNDSKATLPTVTMKNEVCLLKLTYDGVPAEDWDNSFAVNPLIINDGTHEYIINYPTNDNGVMYLAMLPTAGATFTFYTHSRVRPYYMKDNKTFRGQRGIYFTRVDTLGDWKPYSRVTTDHVGCVLDKNLNVYSIPEDGEVHEKLSFSKTVMNVTLEAGKLYNSSVTLIADADTDPEITPIAVITHVGDYVKGPYPTGYSGFYGIAMALFDADGGWLTDDNFYPNETYQWKTSKGTLDNDTFQIASESKLEGELDNHCRYTDGLYWTSMHHSDEYPAFKAAWEYGNICGFDPSSKINNSHWFLPSAYQWQLMVNSCNQYLTPYFGGGSKFSDGSWYPGKITYACYGRLGEALSNGFYWTSSEYNANNAWNWTYGGNSSAGHWYSNASSGDFGGNSKTVGKAVRAVFYF